MNYKVNDNGQLVNTSGITLRDAQKPVMRFNEPMTIAFTLPAGKVAAGDTFALAIDTDNFLGDGLCAFQESATIDVTSNTVTFANVATNTQKLLDKTNGRPGLVMAQMQVIRYVGGALTAAQTVVDDNAFLRGIVYVNGATAVLLDPNASYTKDELDALMATAPEFQFSTDGQNWHAEQADSDIYLRFRNPAAKNPTWSGAVKFLPADVSAMVAAAQAAREGAETAQGKAETAQGKAETAQGKAEAAATAANAAKEAILAQIGNATTAANTATQKATEARNSASQAQTAASTAAQKATDATNAANTAAQNATEATNAANAAQGAQTAAGQFKTQAQTAANDAVAAKNAAVEAKGQAESAANTAAENVTATIQAKNTAVQKANQAIAAAESASSAATAAVNAKEASETAQGKAETAKTDAETAKADAVQAKTDAVSAKGEAQTAAQTATQAAASIGDSVQTCQTLKNQTQAIYESVQATVATYYVGPAYNYGVTVSGTILSFTWTDPADNNVVKWAKTRLLMKTGGFPADETDGTILIDETTRNQHKTTPFTWDAGVTSNYYFALFTQSTGGTWHTGDDCPRFTTDQLTWATIAMMTRAGTLLQYPDMAIGSVVPIKVNDLYPKMRYRLAHIDYKGTFAEIGDFMYDNTRLHNSIWIPQYLPCLGADNNNASMMQFDAPETSYGATWDTAFITGKAYYTVSGETYTQLTEGTDYQDGDSVADWQTLHGDTVYSKNHSSRVSYGNNIWKESNMRQWLNASGNDWFQKQNEYDVKSGNTGYRSGWLTGYVSGFLDLVMPVYNKTARNTTATISGGGGGGYDMTLDKFWLPSLKEFNGSNVNNIAEGSQFAYFRDVATTNTQRIQYDEGGTARNCFLRSPNTGNVTNEYNINTSGSANYNSFANYACAFLPAMCIA